MRKEQITKENKGGEMLRASETERAIELIWTKYTLDLSFDLPTMLEWLSAKSIRVDEVNTNELITELKKRFNH